MSKVTMLYGPIGAGKTSLARQLERQGAVRLSLDEWTIAASGSQSDVDPDVVERILQQLLNFWPRVATRGCDVVLDLAFWSRAHRDQVRGLAARLRVDAELIWIDCQEAERRDRCINRSPDAQDSYVIDGDAFDWISQNRTIDALGTDEPHLKVDTSSR